MIRVIKMAKRIASRVEGFAFFHRVIAKHDLVELAAIECFQPENLGCVVKGAISTADNRVHMCRSISFVSRLQAFQDWFGARSFSRQVVWLASSFCNVKRQLLLGVALGTLRCTNDVLEICFTKQFIGSWSTCHLVEHTICCALVSRTPISGQ